MKLYSRGRLAFLLFLCGLTFLKWNEAQNSEELESTRLAQCPNIPDVSHRPLGETDFSGRHENVTDGIHDDVFLFDREGKMKVGARGQWGASLIFFGEGANNTLDNSTRGGGVTLKFHSPTLIAHQAGNSCGASSRIDAWDFSPMSATISLLNFSCLKNAPNFSQLRLNQSLRFVKRGVLEIEYAITNFGDDVLLEKSSELPALHANEGAAGGPTLNVLRNSLGKTLSAKDREPTSQLQPQSQGQYGTEGWASLSDASDQHGIAIYWENRKPQPRVSDPSRANTILSDYGFTIAGKNTTRARMYLVLGGFEHARTEIQTLDRELPPFGRIEFNSVNEDTRSVTLKGWALDNKEVTALELWVDGKKFSDLKLNEQRADICATYPGYYMCEKSRATIGFSGTYSRPIGSGCPRPVEVRARDNDGNWRTIARNSISPVMN